MLAALQRYVVLGLSGCSHTTTSSDPARFQPRHDLTNWSRRSHALLAIIKRLHPDHRLGLGHGCETHDNDALHLRRDDRHPRTSLTWLGTVQPGGWRDSGKVPVIRV
jgi:hypothetical protein